MSSLVFPTLPGLSFPLSRVPLWNTGVQSSPSGKESRQSYMQYPLVRFEFDFEFLREYATVNEIRAIAGLFNACKGQYDTFLYSDPDFNSVTLENFGSGTGSQTQFQLIATYQNVGGPGGAERIQNLNGSPSIYKAGVLQTITTHYTIGPTGIITFVTAPAAAAALTWTGGFYYRCRFLDDELAAVKFMGRTWELPVRFQSIAL